MSHHRLDRATTALLVIDIQERLTTAMNPAACERFLRRSMALVTGAKALGLPIVVTEQYPKGLGATVAALREAIPNFSAFEKITYTCVSEPVVAALQGRRQILLCGAETHVCVFQTARDLAARGLTPFLCADAVLSRTEEDRRIGFDLCRAEGAVITTVEAALFDLLGRAGTPEFKAVSAAVK
jgi:nicotinamidase-related amidase